MKVRNYIQWIITIGIVMSTFAVIFFVFHDNVLKNFGIFENDTDDDSVFDAVDNCRFIENSSQENFDGDALGDICDTDDDNDEIVDSLDAFDLDQSEWADFDFDGIGSNQDLDDDNDGILDDYDYTPIVISRELTENYLQEIQDCTLVEEGTPRLLCNAQFFHNLIENDESNENVLELAFALSKLQTIDDCHFVSHLVGHAAFEKNPDIYENTLPIQNSTCRGGYYHGLLEAYFHYLKENDEPFPTSYKTLCDGFLGTSIYRGCVHGLGHGFVNYYQDNLELAIEPCHQMSLFQDIFCLSGVMMQYTDNQMTRYGLTEENISNMCSKQELNSQEYWNCSGNIGVSLAFHTNHNLEVASKFCNMIDDNDGQKFCLEKLQNEIDKALGAKISPLTEEETIKFQPKWIKQGDKKWIVDFHSLAIISDFNYVEDIKTMTFSFDKITSIRIYVWSNLLPEKPVVTIDGGDGIWHMKSDEYENYTMIKISPKTFGTVTISGT